MTGVPIQLPMVNIFSKENGRLLVIRSMREDASDVYSCVASNAAGQAAVDSSINVIPSGKKALLLILLILYQITLLLSCYSSMNFSPQGGTNNVGMPSFVKDN